MYYVVKALTGALPAKRQYTKIDPNNHMPLVLRWTNVLIACRRTPRDMQLKI